jgi:hypothetical protein
MNKNLFLIIVYFAIHSIPIANAQTLTNKEMQDIKGFTISSCYRTQRAANVNSHIPDAKIRNYCTCFTNKLFERTLTVNEFRTAKRIQQSRGNDAMMSYLLNGRDIYEIAEACSK